MRNLSKKGFYDVLREVEARSKMHYNEILKYTLEKKLVKSRASVTTILNGLTGLGLLDRMVTDARPIRTTYQLSKKGKSILNLLKQIERETAT